MTRRRVFCDQRGASLTEYALVLVLLLVIAAGAFKLLGGQNSKSGDKSNQAFNGQAAEHGGAGGGGGGGGGTEGAPTVGGKSGVAQKMSVAAGGAAPVKRSRGEALATDAKSKIAQAIGIEEFTFKKFARWMAIGLGALGLAVGFVVFKRGRRAAAEAAEGGDAPEGSAKGAAGKSIASNVGAAGGGPTKWTD